MPLLIRGDKILLVSERNLYHIPGGGVELGETPENAVIREIKEETGFEISNPRFAGMLSTFFTSTHKTKHKSSVHAQSLLLYYLCDITGGEMSLDGQEEDEKEYGLTPEWVSINKLNTVPVGSTVDWRPVVKEALRIQTS